VRNQRTGGIDVLTFLLLRLDRIRSSEEGGPLPLGRRRTSAAGIHARSDQDESRQRGYTCKINF